MSNTKRDTVKGLRVGKNINGFPHRGYTSDSSCHGISPEIGTHALTTLRQFFIKGFYFNARHAVLKSCLKPRRSFLKAAIIISQSNIQ